MYSPEYIQTSLAAAISLGFEHGSFKEPVRLTGLNLLLTYDKGCKGRCAYCGISNSRFKIHKMDLQDPAVDPGINQKVNNIETGIKKHGPKKTFIRVKWPVYRLANVLDALKGHEDNFERICLSMVTHEDAVKDTITISRIIKQSSSLPLSLLITPTLIKSPEILLQFKDAGAEMVGIAIDAATEAIFENYRGKGTGGPHKWQKYWEVLEWAVDIFGCHKAGIHLIVGLGETEEEAVKIIYQSHLMGAKTHLFSFYPEPGSMLEYLDPPELVSYRKIQIARYLINEKDIDISKIRFESNNGKGKTGMISSFDYDLTEVLKEGIAFMTSGCPCNSDSRISACNRPFANERPSETFRNYPYVPTDADRKVIAGQISGLIHTGMKEQ